MRVIRRTLAAIILSVFLPALSARAAPSVVLLTSIKTPDVWFHSNEWELSRSLEEKFRKAFDESGYRIVVKHEVDQVTLWETLRSPDNIAVFWVSHGAGTRADGGMGLTSLILNSQGSDVKNLFQSVHPGLRWLGMIGCETRGMVDDFSKQGFYRSNPDLKIQSFETKVDAESALIYSMNDSLPILADRGKTRDWQYYGREERFKYVEVPVIRAAPALLREPPSSACPVEQGLPIIVQRKIPADIPESALRELQISVNGRLLGVLPKPKAGDTQSVQFYISEETLRDARSLKLIVSTGISIAKEGSIHIGNLTVWTPMSGKFEIFADSDGRPIGETSHLYRYSGALDSIGRTRPFSQVTCNPAGQSAQIGQQGMPGQIPVITPKKPKKMK